jgi:hypothetical protein
MKEIPVLFSTSMVKAISEGSKTQTRRLVKPLPHPYGTEIIDSGRPWYKGKGRWHNRVQVNDKPVRYEIVSLHDCRYGQPCDRLWVRETWQHTKCLNINPEDENYGFVYKADGDDWEFFDGWTWKPSIHMPKAAARIWLEVINVRVERLQDISEQDAIAEGVSKKDRYIGYGAIWEKSYREGFFNLWDRINGDKYPVIENPWVWVIEFKRV